MRQIILDTETTGLDPSQGHRLTEIGCIEMVDRCLTGKTFHSYLNPERELDAKASEITGLTLSFLQDKPKFAEILNDFLFFIQDSELIIHNAPFDLKFLNAELSLLRHPFSGVESRLSVIDTLALARALYPGQKNSLDALCRRYGIDNSHRSLHGALLDAHILAKVYLAMTAGQTSFNLQEEKTTTISSKTYIPKTLIKHGKLNVVRANQEELNMHQERLKMLQSLSKGQCMWLAKDESAN